MGSLFRSEQMALCQLFLQSEASYACISELGELGLVQFRDLNPDVNAFQRKFISEVRRCDEMERRLRYVDKEIKKDSLEILDTGENPEAPQPKEMTEMELTFEKLEFELREINQNADALKKNYFELTELKHILRKTQVFFDEQENGPNSTESMTKALINDQTTRQRGGAASRSVQLGFLAGVILREKIPAFETMLWRACRGNVFLRLAEIETPLEEISTSSFVYKSVFIIFFQGERLKVKIKKICEGFRATLYPCPETQVERSEMAMGVMTRIEDLNIVLGQTQDHRRLILVAAAKKITNWFIKVRKIKAIYHTLNLFNLDVTQKCLIGECWIPVLDMENIQLALRRGTQRSGSTVPPILNSVQTSEMPPTFKRTNKFTRGFQNLVDSYGVASYRETNPGPFTIITFPFLFAVMFGDAGHGLILTCLGAWMVIMEKRLQAKKSDSDIWNIFFGGRYIILLMGLFSIYTGLIYNDVFSKSTNIFGSSWKTDYNKSTIEHNGFLTLDPKTPEYVGDPYPFGVDPVWQLSENKINFLNNYKMKISIIFGVGHMLFGVLLSLRNYLFFHRTVDIFGMFVPQIIFLCFLFLYLVVLVFLKWIIYSAKSSNSDLEPYCAPSILITFIDMVLLKQSEGNAGCDPYMYPGQRQFQLFLYGVALICIPWMLLTKPIYEMIMRKKKYRGRIPSSNHVVGDTEVGNDTSGNTAEKHRIHEEQEEEEEPMSEIFIHQGIHTIEYVLGSVSHTASYLRLWALSLAHAQLSEVLWQMVFSKALHISGYPGCVAVYLIFAFWAALTIAILVLMEGLSAFLHTLRLHWVEFQSKFYEGKGYALQPFSFQIILEQANLSDE